MATTTYDGVLAEIKAAVGAEDEREAALRRSVEILKARVPHYTWVGIYLLEDHELVLGPFLGKPSPHTRIPLHRGLCGAAASERRTIVVDNVDADPRYLACSLETRSEIVAPIMRGDEVLGEIDIDSDRPAAFGPSDRALVEATATLLAAKF
ncbi:MAG: GAF domain-containing protein [Vicinamibacterales bacterium]